MTSVNVVINEEDLPFEEELLRNPHSLKSWLRYIEARSDAPAARLNLLYERALKELPGSYKLWHRYLKLRLKQGKGRCPVDPSLEEVNNCFERSLVFMHKMPRIWIEYANFLVDGQAKVTRARRVLDRALRALPVTQHDRIWPIYLDLVRRHQAKAPETAVRVFRRYLQLFPEQAEEFVECLVSIGRLDEAARVLAKLVNDPDFVPRIGKVKTNHGLWNELCDLIVRNPKQIRSLNVDAVIRSGLRRYTDQTGRLWNCLADYYIRSGLFERARDIYEEAVQTVTTVRDFTQIFDAFAQFEELALSKKMELVTDQAEDEHEVTAVVELYMARFEDLIERRPLLLNSVLLRQNPHNVSEWQKRVVLLQEASVTGSGGHSLQEVVDTFTEAVQTVDPKQAVGRLQDLWIDFARFYEKNDQVEDARIIFEKSTHAPFVKVEHLAHVWCEYAEMELRVGDHEAALRLLRRATAPPPPGVRVSYHDQAETAQVRLHKSLKVWSLLADLEESFGTFQTTKAVYDRILELKIASPQIVINYALFLKEHNYFEEAFKAYEKGLALFKWPNVYDIWSSYLSEFLDRYGGLKLERARDLFEQCLEACPEKLAKAIYLLYAKLEEQHGLARRAMAVYDRAVEKVDKSERKAIFNVYLRKAAEIYGVTRTRQIYERAVETLEDPADAREMSMRFAELETKLGEIDRARAIYSHCSQMCDPRVAADFWLAWKDFEVKHGNEDTLREMLRIKRSVQHTYNTQINMMSAQMLAGNMASSASAAMAAEGKENVDKMQQLEAAAEANDGAEKMGRGAAGAGGSISFVRGETQSKAVNEAQINRKADNPDEINIDDGEDDDDEGAEEVDSGEARSDKKVFRGVEKQAVPTEVFGGLVKDDEDD